MLELIEVPYPPRAARQRQQDASLDAASWLDFSPAGTGRLLDDLGTSRGSRKVQAYNGRALISLEAKPA